VPGQDATATIGLPASDTAALEAQLQSDNIAFDPSLRCLIGPPLSGLDKALAELDGLAPAERNMLVAAAGASLTETIRRKVSRVLVLELNAARVSGSLRSETSEARWSEFLERAGRMDLWMSLTERYPTLLSRLAVLISGRINGAFELGRRFASSRSQLGPLIGGGDLELTGVRFGAGDSHRTGRTVAIAVGVAGLLALVIVGVAIALIVHFVRRGRAPPPQVCGGLREVATRRWPRAPPRGCPWSAWDRP